MIKCAVDFCPELGSQLHHWAPYSIFGEDSESWPTSYLCEAHHTFWHQQTGTTGGQKYLQYANVSSGHRGADLMYQRLCHVAPEGLSAAQLARRNRAGAWRYTECREFLEREYLAFSVQEPRSGARGRPYIVTYSTCPLDMEPSAWLKLSRSDRLRIINGEAVL